MFDTVTGLPVHILVSHFAVAFLPLGAVATIAVVLRKAWRERFAMPLAAANIGMLALAFVTMRAGEDLQDRYRGLGDAQTPKYDHESLGRTLVWILAGLAVVSLANWALQPMRAQAPAAVLALSVVVALVAASSIVFSVLAGHTGSESHWKEFVQNSNEQLSKQH